MNERSCEGLDMVPFKHCMEVFWKSEGSAKASNSKNPLVSPLTAPITLRVHLSNCKAGGVIMGPSKSGFFVVISKTSERSWIRLRHEFHMNDFLEIP